MEKKIQGSAFVFGKNVDTDQIFPGRFVELTEPEDIKKYCLYGADEHFVEKCQPGDIVVASTNFGCGSSREHAAMTLKYNNVGAVIAESYGRIFFRNAINLGIPAITCKGIDKMVNTGDKLSVDFETGVITNLTTGATAQTVPMSPYIMNILEHGGIKPMLKAEQDAKKAAQQAK